MTKEQMVGLMSRLHAEEKKARGAGQQEYAQDDSNAFANFERVASATDTTREVVLLVYLLKHIDGISAYVKGHRSQREPIRGRITDARVYLALLAGMVEEDEGKLEEESQKDLVTMKSMAKEADTGIAQRPLP